MDVRFARFAAPDARGGDVVSRFPARLSAPLARLGLPAFPRAGAPMRWLRRREERLARATL